VSGLGVGAAGAVAAAVLFIIGEPPDKYRAFHAGLSITPSGSGLTLAGAF